MSMLFESCFIFVYKLGGDAMLKLTVVKRGTVKISSSFFGASRMNLVFILRFLYKHDLILSKRFLKNKRQKRSNCLVF